MVLSFLYWVLRRLLELFVLCTRSEREKEVEILVLCYQLRVLARQVARPQLLLGDRALLSAFSRGAAAASVGVVCGDARESGLGVRRIEGELLGVSLAAGTVWEILRARGSSPAPRRLESS